MATVQWIGNAQATQQIDTLTVTAVAVGGTLSATINTKVVTYTCVTGDTTTTAATAWFALLVSQSAIIPEFGELTFANPSAGVITCTATVPGTPFTMTTGSAGGATLTQSTTTANSSPSDVNNAKNWLRSGSNAIPQNGDDVVLSNTAVPLLWNLSALAAVQFASFTRWQDFTGTVGLPENNPRGYREYRQTYFQFTGSGTLTMLLGQGTTGSGPGRERYDVGGQRTNLIVLGGGGALDAYQVRFLGTHVSNTISVRGTSVGIAMLPTETSVIASGTVDGNATLALGSGVTFSGALTASNASVLLDCAVAGTLTLDATDLTVNQTGLTFPAVVAGNGSTLTWLAGGTVTALTMTRGTIFDKSQDLRALTLTDSTIDSDCQILDPYNTITFTNATTVKGVVTQGLVTFRDRTIKVV